MITRRSSTAVRQPSASQTVKSKKRILILGNLISTDILTGSIPLIVVKPLDGIFWLIQTFDWLVGRLVACLLASLATSPREYFPSPSETAVG